METPDPIPASSDSSQDRFLWVHDDQRGKMRRLDVSNCERFGPAGHSEGYTDDGIPIWQVTEWLYRHAKGVWTKVAQRAHWEADALPPLEAYRISEEKAVLWLVENGCAIPEDLAEAAREHMFQPGPPPPETSSQGDKDDNPHNKKLRWDPVKRLLYFRGEVIRKVSAKANRVKPLLDQFQKHDWASHVPSPFGHDEEGKEILRLAISQLNKQLLKIKFESDGTGTGANWYELATDDPEIPF